MAQGRLLEISETPREIRRPQPSSDGRPVTRAASRNELCSNCRSVDIRKILESGANSRHSTLAEAAKNVDCAFCRYVVKLARKAYGDLDMNDLKVLDCTLVKARPFGFDSQYRKDDSVYRAEFQLSIQLNQQLCVVTWNGSSYSVISGESRRFLNHWEDLDLLDLPLAIPSIANTRTVARKQLDRTFNCENLLAWLEESDVDETPQLQSIDVNTVSSEQLIRARRFRVLDVISNRIVTLSFRVRYIALSYVWGNPAGRPRSTSGQNGHANLPESQRAASIDIRQLPWTVRDAVELVRRIGERYLWVDALCIDQDDPEDKAAIIPEMSTIYGNAYLTIVAADGSHSNDRLSRLVTGKVSEECVTMVTSAGPITLTRPRPSLQKAIEKCTWNTRGWAFQERHLSRRCVFFTKSGVFFESKTLRTGEAYELVPNAPAGALHSDQKAYDKDESFQRYQPGHFDSYISTLEEYTKRELTHLGDRLDAFSGLLRQLQPQATTPERFDALSGLPLSHFAASLLWYVGGKGTRLQLDTRQSRYLPSWSWSGWEGAVSLSKVSFYVGGTHAKPIKATLKALPEPTIINSANIVCHTPYSMQGLEPELYEVKRPLRVILHMWVKLLPCSLHIVRRLEPGHENVYAVEPLRWESEEEKYSARLNTVILPDGVDASSKFKLLCLHDYVGSFILVREVKPFYERVDYISYPNLIRGMNYEVPIEYVRLC